MSDTSIQTKPNPIPVLPAATPPQTRTGFLWYAKKILKALASLRLTVFLFVLSMILVFCGTLAMMDQGLFTVLSQYFRSGIAWIPFKTFLRFGQVFFGISPDAQVAGSFPFPGGWLIGAALLVNLLAAHAVRFRFTWKRSGILLIHAGLIVLMLGELVTGLFAVESNMTIPVGGSSNYLSNFDRMELAFVSSANAKEDNVVVVPDSQLHTGSVIHDDRLPVDIVVDRYFVNSSLPTDIPAGAENLATRGFGLQTVALEEPPGRGVDAEQKRDMPSAYLTFKDKKTGQALDTYLVSSLWSNSQVANIDGTPYQVALRLKRDYLPYTLHLEELKHETYRGTSMAKRYASLVRVTGDNGLDREVMIHMNHPFYFDGRTFYQSQVDSRNGVEVTGLQVVRNPGWAMPYIACAMVSGGMVIHFLLHLLGFIHRKGTV